MSNSMGGYDDPFGREPSMTAHEEDAERYSSKFGTKIVQVRIAGANARTYAYEAPRGEDVAIGDWVTLPGNVVNEHGGFGVVKSFGRDGYNGPLKSIVRVIPEPHPLEIKMSVVKTKDQAAKIYDQAVALGWSGEQLTDLAVIGEQRLRARGVQ